MDHARLIDEIFEYRLLRGDRDLGQKHLSPALAHRLETLEARMASSGDRRRYRRIAANIQAGIATDSNWALTKLVDVSAGGFSASYRPGIELGQVVRLRLGNKDQSYEFSGQVAWTHGARIGVAFLGVPRRVTRGRQAPASFSPPSPAQGQKRLPREPVNLEVRYGTANEFVREYAENLSCGGVFVRGAQHLDVGQAVELSLRLPGLGILAVVAEVVHTVSVEKAKAEGRSPGAGMAIIDGPPNLSTVLSDYLARLGRRRDYRVLTNRADWIHGLSSAGYNVEGVASHTQLSTHIQIGKAPIVGIVVTRPHISKYRRAVSSLQLRCDVVSPSGDNMDEVILSIDEQIFAHLKRSAKSS